MATPRAAVHDDREDSCIVAMKCTTCAVFRGEPGSSAVCAARHTARPFGAAGCGWQMAPCHVQTARTTAAAVVAAPSIIGARPAPFAHSGAPRCAPDAVNLPNDSLPQTTEQCSCEHS